MSDNTSHNQNQSDEIDLGQLFALIGKGFGSLFKGLLKVFLYLKKNAIILGSLVVIGALLGYGSTFLGEVEEKLDVIVTPNLKTKNYLYNIVEELQADLMAKDTAFFNSLGMKIEKMEGFKLEINSLGKKGVAGENDMKFMELLKDFERNEAISDIIRAELQDKTTKEVRITFFFKDGEIGEEYAQKIMSYINSNPYYKELLEIYTLNAQNRIQRNDSLIAQIDVLINNYTQNMLKEQATTEGRLVLENQEPLNIPSLFTLKNQLIQDIETKKLELKSRQEAITIVNFGKPYKEHKSLFQKNIVLFPIVFVGLFFMFSFIRFLNRKSKELQIG